MLGRLRGIRSKFLLLLLPPVVIATVLMSSFYVYMTHKELEEELFLKQQDLSLNNSIALAGLMAKEDLDSVDRMLRILVHDPDVSGVKITDLKNDTVAALGWDGSEGIEDTYVVTNVITDLVDEQTDWEVYGTLHIRFYKGRIKDIIAQQIVRDFLFLILIIVVTVLSAVFANRYIVQKRLQRFLEDIRPIRQADDAVQADEPPDDEIGLTVKAYNRLARRLESEAAALRASEASLIAALESSPFGVVIAARDGRRLYCNAAFADQYGAPQKEVLSINPDLCYANPDDRGRLYEILYREGAVEAQEVRMRRKDGTLWWSLCHWRPIEYKGVKGYIGWFREIDRETAAAAAH